MISRDIAFRHLIVFIVPGCLAAVAFVASRIADIFWLHLTGVVLALLAFYFTMSIMNRLLFAPVEDEGEIEDLQPEPPASG